jgi:hypothetical protein
MMGARHRLGKRAAVTDGENERGDELSESFMWSWKPVRPASPWPGTSRAIEMHPPLWPRMWGALGTGTFNVRVVR